MNKFLAILGVVVLAGAGCTSTTQVETSSQTQPDTQAQADTTEPSSSGLGIEASAGTSGQILVKNNDTGDTQTIKLDNGAVVEVEPVKDDTATTTPPADDKIVDVVLGGDVDQTVNMEMGNFFFKPNVINAKAGERIKLVYTKNAGFHTFVIDEIGLKAPITEGQSVIFTAPTKAGSYTFYCDVGSHRAMGMEGTLIVK